MTREDILAEIKRTAATNGCTPLGWKRFTAETGIQEREWLGRFWARWSDAIKEAGLAPNQLTVAKDDTALLEAYASLAHDLGRLPTAADMRLRATTSSGFPSDKTFDKRFGNKATLVERLREWCAARAGYDDVVAHCDSYEPPRNQPSSTPSGDAPSEDGWVYLKKMGKFYKIGLTNDAGRRHRELATQMPEKLTTVHEIRTDDPRGIEAYWHNRFAAKRRNGEWFDLSGEDVAAFKRRKFM